MSLSAVTFTRAFLFLADQLITDYVGFEVFTVVVMKSINFWDVMLCS
jgi:hypothetical protein